MLVYGDLNQHIEAGQECLEIAEGLDALRVQSPSLARHARLVSLLIRAGSLLQALSDADFHEAGADDVTMRQADLMARVLELARATWLSWQSGFTLCPFIDPDAWRALQGRLDLSLSARIPEGFAFYGVYPESYATAARLSGLTSNTWVIGLRSIGATLAPMVAAALKTNRAITLRPVGPVFDRQLKLHADLRRNLLAEQTIRYAVVDEGPGLSGSSFGSVLNFLEETGVGADRVVLFPSHAGSPGPHATPGVRNRFRQTRSCVRDFDDLVLNAPMPAHRLETWLAPVIGDLSAPLKDLSGGRWRLCHYGSSQAWPPVHPFQERRKFLAQTLEGMFLVKFVGLGQEGQRKFELAQRLYDAGFCPRPVGYCHGFLVEDWHGEASPVDIRQRLPPGLTEHVGRYLAWRSRHLPSRSDRGASCALLFDMAQQNVREGLSDAMAECLRPWGSCLADLQLEIRPMETDGRLHAHEWLLRPDGRLLKTDAVDHHASHDVIGCQDVSWDIAGASFEFGLDSFERERLVSVVEGSSGRKLSADLLAFMQVCYCAFQLGSMTMARDAHVDPDEASRANAVVERCRASLTELVRTQHVRDRSQAGAVIPS